MKNEKNAAFSAECYLCKRKSCRSKFMEDYSCGPSWVEKQLHRVYGCRCSFILFYFYFLVWKIFLVLLINSVCLPMFFVSPPFFPLIRLLVVAYCSHTPITYCYVTYYNTQVSLLKLCSTKNQHCYTLNFYDEGNNVIYLFFIKCLCICNHRQIFLATKIDPPFHLINNLYN